MLPMVLSPRTTRNVARRDYVALNNGVEVAGPSCPTDNIVMTHAGKSIDTIELIQSDGPSPSESASQVSRSPSTSLGSSSEVSSISTASSVPLVLSSTAKKEKAH